MDTDCIFYIYVPYRENPSPLCSYLKTKTKTKQKNKKQKKPTTTTNITKTAHAKV